MTNCNILTLDNASLIYPASLSKKYASLFRMSVSLTEEIDLGILQTALQNTVRRIPTFGYTLSNGSFWWYLSKLEKTPQIMDYQRLHLFNIKNNDGFLFRLSVKQSSTIVLDIFHVLTDGNGAMTFLLTLVAEYLKLRHGISVPYAGRILDPLQPCRLGETEDAFDTFSGKKGSLEQNDPAYHLRGRAESSSVLNDIRVKMSASQVCSLAKAYNCTVTDLLTASMVYVLQDVWKNDRRCRRSSVLKVNVPVDLRRIFGSVTLRNFSSYVHLGVDVRNGFYDFPQIVEIVSAQKKLYSMPSQLEPKVAKNVQLEDNFAISCIPRFLKKPIIDIINKLKGDRYCTHTLSNIGRIDLPESMLPYVKEIDFMLGRQRGNTGASACVSCGDSLVLNMSRRIVETKFEDLFLAHLASLGIQAEIERLDDI